ncbi:Right origin-binding protein [Pelotomaculum sp. FP]|uniref:helix-turn-helix domain-containing protein n=1 Tax=Pelotomaculum sp. FP TaxID=261474 RepID=UPI001065BB9A|nr:helix-turn-helix domain-containing protein [Pelotomaculum sp. FP]TEB10411.1 Right origin-binding protein [Pelotomaculum sp. FP]
MHYIGMINDAIQYIEANLHRKLCLKELSAMYYISPMHFYRIFRAVTNQTVKSYVLGRKLSEAAIALKNTDYKVVDIAFRYGFNSHEQFTRNFLKMFHVTPNRYRKENVSVPLMDRIDVLERDFRNVKKDVVIDYFCRELKEIKLLGKDVLFHPEDVNEVTEVFRMVISFKEEFIIRGTAGRLFSVVRADRGDPSRIYCFVGIAAEEYWGDRSGLADRSIPASKYAVFKYPGKMGLIFHTVMKDLYKWLDVTGLEINVGAGIDMFELFPEDYAQTGKFYLYVPVL